MERTTAHRGAPEMHAVLFLPLPLHPTPSCPAATTGPCVRTTVRHRLPVGHRPTTYLRGTGAPASARRRSSINRAFLLFRCTVHLDPVYGSSSPGVSSPDERRRPERGGRRRKWLARPRYRRSWWPVGGRCSCAPHARWSTVGVGRGLGRRAAAGVVAAIEHPLAGEGGVAAEGAGVVVPLQVLVLGLLGDPGVPARPAQAPRPALPTRRRSPRTRCLRSCGRSGPPAGPW